MEHLLHAVDVGCLPFWVVARVLGRSLKRQLLALFIIHLFRNIHGPGDSVIESMALQIGLVHNPQAELVGKVEQFGVRRIMRASQGVDVVRLHEKQVFLDEVQRHRAAVQWMVLVPVDTAKSYGFAIDGNESVLEFDDAEPDSFGDMREDLVSRGEAHLDRVQVRSLRSPMLDTGYV